MSRKLKIIFTVSVFCNIILLGAIAGFMIKNDFAPGSHFVEMKQLSPQARRMVRTSFGQSRQNITGLFNQARGLREKVIADLDAPVFDSGVFLKDSQNMRSVQDQIMAERARVAASVAAQLSQQDRRSMADWLASIHPPAK